MLISRGWNVVKLTSQHSRLDYGLSKLRQTQRSHSMVAYRSPPSPPKHEAVLCEVFGGFAWWWIIWHFWHDYKHITGEWDYPDSSKWTDEELGIPPDDED